MSNKIIFTVDVEKDLHTGETLGITQGLKRFEKICDKNNIKPILFVTGEVLEKHPRIFKGLQEKDWEISSHGFTHSRFDEMTYPEKEEEIRRCINSFKKYLGKNPKGFRAPQHSIDEQTLDLLEKHGFEYDSSYTPLNKFQFLFFPKKLKLNLKGFFSPLNPYRIRKNLLERPPASFGIPFVSLTIRVLPKPIIKIYLLLLKLLYDKPIFYAHSWDFIELKQSKIDRKFSHNTLLNKIDYLMKLK